MLLAERDSQIGQLSELYDGSARGKGSVAIVSGPVGVGKSRLLRAFAEHMEASGASVLTATCSEWDRNNAWGVLQQLLSNVQRPDGRPTAIAKLLRAGMATASWSELDPGETRQVSAQVMQWLWTAEQSGANGPTLVVVDDAHHIDPPSLQFLLQFARRLVSAPGMLVLSVPEGHTGLAPELLRLPHSARLRLPLLSEAGVAALVEDAGSQPWHELSGGNPLLVHALAADRAAAPPPDPAAGDEFSQAVLTCLHRSGSEALAVAHGLAVLGGSSTPALMAQLLDIDVARVPVALRALTNVGLVVGNSFRHESIRAVVLQSLTDRSGLHLRAAQLLHSAGASASTVAEHVIQAGDATAPSMTDVLRDAAEQALEDDRVEFAVACLEMARSAAPAGINRLRITVLLTMAEWRLNAATAMRHLPELAAGLGEGRLTGRDLVAAKRFLFWYGRGDEAAPRLSAQLDETIGNAEKVLETSRLTDATIESKASAILALVYADQLDKASRWCASLLDEAESRRAPSWQAMFTAIDAEIALRRGSLQQAKRSASTALSLMSSTGWGVGIGMPLSTLLLANTAMGMLDEALDNLGQPVPEAMFQTRFGLQYLYARGRYFLVTNRLHAALDDFMKCGAQMTAWNMDVPSMIPWRAAAAMAHMAMGNHEKVRELVTEQLGRPGGDRSRTRGVSLRLLAATSELPRRLALLQESIELLQTSGDRLELALALADLSHAQRAMGEPNRARITTRFASKVAVACGAKPLLMAAQVANNHKDLQQDPDDSAHNDANGIDVLSDAERRVAILAARGDTNQEIAQRLFITVSTVEQHLTRVYRKLGVSGRTDLPAELVS